MPYVVEEYTAEERLVLERYFTDIDGPVFAIVNLHTVVAGALMSRYSRSPKSLRRLFLDEFAEGVVAATDGAAGAPAGVDAGSARAQAFYDKNFVEYGDDSIAQLGGVHLACEQASNVLTKVLEWGRLMSYIEQSTRYIAYDAPLGGRYRYHRDPAVLASPLGARYVAELDAAFDDYAAIVSGVTAHVRATIAQRAGDADSVYRQATRAKGLDAARGMLPAASLANLGIFGSGQGFENLLLRMRAHPLAEARSYADLMLTELRKVIPSFLRRVDVADRGGRWSAYLEDSRLATQDIANRLFAGVPAEDTPVRSPEVQLLDFDPDAEDKLVAAALFSATHVSERHLLERVRQLSADDKVAVLRAYIGTRENRRHKPGRAFERTDYRFEVLGDYGAFRDLQRHRLMTVEWQALTADHGYARPELIDAAGLAARFDAAMDRSAALHHALAEEFPAQAAYPVAMAYRLRYVMQFNAREAMHLLELRTAPQGHPSYRRVCLEMHRLIAEHAGHRAIAAAMSHIVNDAPELERLDAERAQERRRTN